MNEKGKGRKEGLKEEWSLTTKKEKTRQRKERLSEGDEEGQQREQRKGRKEDEKEVEKGEKFEEGSKKDREGERKVFSRGLKSERERVVWRALVALHSLYQVLYQMSS